MVSFPFMDDIQTSVVHLTKYWAMFSLLSHLYLIPISNSCLQKSFDLSLATAHRNLQPIRGQANQQQLS